MASVDKKSLEPIYPEGGGISYTGVAAAPNGDVAISRQIEGPERTPDFLAEGIEALRNIRIPILVPPEEPAGTGGLVPSGEEEFYRLLFTNDPGGELAHVAQINVFVEASTEDFDPVPSYGAQPLEVRGTDGRFFCGASVCFLTWRERDVTYLVGEFGAANEAVAFAESLVPMEHVAGSRWREGNGGPPVFSPQVIVRSVDGDERSLSSKTCVCGFDPLDWNPRSDRLLVLESGDGNFKLLQFRRDAPGEPVTVEERGLPDVILDAAYGPNGVVSLVGETGRESTILSQPGGTGVVTTSSDAGSFDIEGSTLAYINDSRDVIVRDLETGTERTVGEGAIDVSVAPDLIAGSGTPRTNAGRGDGGLPGVLLAVIGLAGVALLAGAALLLVARRRLLD